MNPNERYAAQILDAITKANSGGNRPNVKFDFATQVPKEAGSYEGAQIKTDIRRDEAR
jgi:hypothetical protein